MKVSNNWVLFVVLLGFKIFPEENFDGPFLGLLLPLNLNHSLTPSGLSIRKCENHWAVVAFSSPSKHLALDSETAALCNTSRRVHMNSSPAETMTLTFPYFITPWQDSTGDHLLFPWCPQHSSSSFSSENTVSLIYSSFFSSYSGPKKITNVPFFCERLI